MTEKEDRHVKTSKHDARKYIVNKTKNKYFPYRKKQTYVYSKTHFKCGCGEVLKYLNGKQEFECKHSTCINCTSLRCKFKNCNAKATEKFFCNDLNHHYHFTDAQELVYHIRFHHKE